MHVLRDYTQTVTLPVLRREFMAARGNLMFAKARRLFVRRPERLDPTGAASLENLLAASSTMSKVYELRERLVQIWEQANVSNERLVEQLRDWCAEAESSGIRALEEFATRLRGYALQPTAA